MKLKWYGQAAFLIAAQDGTRIITDPYTPGERLTYSAIDEAADIVTVSHEHFDHNNVAGVKGKPQVVRGVGDHAVKGIQFKGVSAYHDTTQGSQRGPNTIFTFTVDGMKVCHLGDLGHPLSDKEVAEMGPVDVLLAPVGGYFTIDAQAAAKVCDQLGAKVVIPMHFKTPQADLPISSVDGFVALRRNVRRIEGSEVEIEVLPAAQETVVLQPAR
ncbi:MAG: MBL fold metallo-hydrolase [Chloroflexi bacterium]|nr:MBL fold metallo-hydrolase [Chloroflexota bacterium]